MPVGRSPMFRRRRLGEELRHLREARGYTLQHLAAELGWSHAKISRLETAKVRPDLVDVMDILEVLGVPEEQERRLVALARQANQRGWWFAYGEMPARQAAYAELENEAILILEFGLVYVPGLLQTPNYARTRFSDREATADFDVDDAVTGRTERQQVLTRPEPVQYEAILDEGVLRRLTAEPAVMAEQLEHLAAVNERPNVSVRVLEFSARTAYFSRPLSPFALYKLGNSDDPELVVAETETSDVQLGDAEDMARYRVMFDRLSAAALAADASSTLMRTISRDLS